MAGRRQEPSGSKPPEPRVINMLSSSSQVGSSKRVREEDEDTPLVISLDIGDFIICRILVDTGSVAKIYVTFQVLCSEYNNLSSFVQ